MLQTASGGENEHMWPFSLNAGERLDAPTGNMEHAIDATHCQIKTTKIRVKQLGQNN